MTTASALVTALAVMCSLVATVAVAYTLRQALQDLVRAHDRDALRRDAQLSAVLDRFQAIRWEDLAAIRTIDDPTQVGGFLSPDDQAAEAEATDNEPSLWGQLSALRPVYEMDENERQLLEEDFPEDFKAEENPA
jgi:hypothetical protein